MDTVKSVFKFMAVSTLIVGGVLVGGTILSFHFLKLLGLRFENRPTGHECH